MSGPDLEARLGYRFRDGELLATALAHPSYAHEVLGTRGNERLEFLGDAVLDLVVAQLLFEAHPAWREGDLTRTRAALVNRDSLARRARSLELWRDVKLGRTEQGEGAAKASILANCLEAVVGAVYLDGGLEPVQTFARRVFGADLEGAQAERDPKTALQEWAHAERRATPVYELVGDSGAEADEERFTVRVRVAGDAVGEGVGRSKRAAERAAALAALDAEAGARVGEP